MGSRNKITQTVSSPLTEKDSEFYVPPERYSVFVRKLLVKTKRENPLYKRAQFIFVYKSFESKNTYRLRNTNRRMRRYAIAILTDDNRYFYNEYNTKQTVLSELTSSNMSKIFLDGYIIDNNTMIILDSRIAVINEPISIFLSIVARCAGISVMRRNILQMMGTLNRIFRFGGGENSKNGNKMTFYHKKYFMRKLVESGQLEFIPKEHLDIIMDKTANLEKRNMRFYAAMGIIYMYRSKIRKDYITKR
jgi:hypothetical protein